MVVGVAAACVRYVLSSTSTMRCLRYNDDNNNNNKLRDQIDESIEGRKLMLLMIIMIMFISDNN